MKSKLINFLTLASQSAAAIARGILILLTFFNQVMTMSGNPVIDFDSEAINFTVSNLCFGLAVFLGYWKNNSFTSPAKAADMLKNNLKSKIKSLIDIEISTIAEQEEAVNAAAESKVQ